MTENKNTTEDKRQKTGSCRFCGQSRMIELSEDEWLALIKSHGMGAEDIADYIAAQECGCKEGRKWRHTTAVLNLTGENIEALFREKLPDLADILQEAKSIVWEGKIKRLTAKTQESGTAYMYRKEGELIAGYAQKTEKKMIAG